jgi:hypothetical protein
VLFGVVVADGVFSSGFTLLHDTLIMAVLARSVDGPEAFGWLSVLSHEASMMLALTLAVSAAARRICFM